MSFGGPTRKRLARRLRRRGGSTEMTVRAGPVAGQLWGLPPITPDSRDASPASTRQSRPPHSASRARPTEWGGTRAQPKASSEPGSGSTRCVGHRVPRVGPPRACRRKRCVLTRRCRDPQAHLWKGRAHQILPVPRRQHRPGRSHRPTEWTDRRALRSASPNIMRNVRPSPEL